MKLWIVEKWLKNTYHPESGDKIGVQSCVGVFDSEEEALKNCLDFKHSIAPLYLNESSHGEDEEWEGMRYPVAEEMDQDQYFDLVCDYLESIGEDPHCELYN